MEDLHAELERVDPESHQAPVDIRLGDTVPVAVPELAYRNYGKAPIKMKINNTGYTVTVSGKYDGDPPAISGGPLVGAYKFSQLHFHWGPDDGEGSEHTFEGRSVPLEMHAVHVNQKYATQEEALLKKDGVAILAFLFVRGPKHEGLEAVARALPEVAAPLTSFKIGPQPLQSLCTPFGRDYFCYWGSVISPSCSHLVQWLVCRDPLQAAPAQFDAFRRLLSVNEEPLLRNYRDCQELRGRTVFHLAPGGRDGFALNCSPELTTAVGEGRPSAAPGRDASSLLSPEQPCTSLAEAESRAGLDGAQRTESGRLLERTPSGRLVEKTPSGRLVERTTSGRLVEKTASGRLVERTTSGRLVERTASGRLVEKTASGRLVERTPSGRLVDKSQSEHTMDMPASASPDGAARLDGAYGADDLAAEPPPAVPQPEAEAPTSAGEELEQPPQLSLPDNTVSAHELETSRVDTSGEQWQQQQRAVERTASGRLPSMGSRVVSFSKLTGPIKARSGTDWPDAPFEGPHTASPVFMDANKAVRLPCPPLEFLGHFKTGVGLLLTNSGETVEISFLKATERPVLQGGPLQARYILDSAHYHWLPHDDAQGGTHTINNARAEIECHLVHVREDYKSKTEAMDHPNGLAVVSVLHQVGGAECAAFQRLCRELPRIAETYTQVEVPGQDLSYLSAVAKSHEYFLYPGRFFGRDDGKPLVWIVYSQPIGICCQNVAAFQALKLSLDFRQHDTYPLGDRPLYAVVPEGGGREEGAGEEVPAVGDLRRTASGRVHALAADEWPNAPFVSKHGMLMAPLDIRTSTVPSVPMPPLEYRGHFPADLVPFEMRNTGDAVDLTWKEAALPTLAGGPLTDEYVFDSAHFHWAQNQDDVGAMHRVNGKRCDLEFHMVHYRKSLRTRQDAMFVPDGLAVTSFLIQVGGEESESFARLTDQLANVKRVDAAVDVAVSLGWLQQRAGPHGFVTYPGTLFGAEQDITVVWIVYPTPLKICCQHIARFYKLEGLQSERVHPLHEPLDRPLFHSINPDNCT